MPISSMSREQRHAYHLQAASTDNVAAARTWVDALEATGGTAINDALAAALGLRTSEGGRHRS